MIVYNNKEYRNLQEQVQKNKADIEDWNSKEDTLANFGIKIIGKCQSESQLPDVAKYDYGDAYMVGEDDSDEGYTYYIATRPTTEVTTKHWQNIGKLSITGPEGPKGDEIKSITNSGKSSTTSGSTKTTTNKITVTMSDARTIQFNVLADADKGEKGDQGIQGIQGEKGDKGDKGERGDQGPQGEMGPTAPAYHIVGTVSSTSALPKPTVLKDLSGAYIVEEDGVKKLYIQIGESIETATWTFLGELSVANFWELSNKILAPVEAVDTVQIQKLAVLTSGGLSCASPSISGVASCSAINSPSSSLTLSGKNGVELSHDGTTVLTTTTKGVSVNGQAEFGNLIIKDNKLQYKYDAGTKGVLATDNGQTLLQSQGDLKLFSDGTNKTSGLKLTNSKSTLYSPTLALMNKATDSSIVDGLAEIKIDSNGQIKEKAYYGDDEMEHTVGYLPSSGDLGFSYDIGNKTMLGYHKDEMTPTLRIGEIDDTDYLTAIKIGSSQSDVLQVYTTGAEVQQRLSDLPNISNMTLGTKLYTHDDLATYQITLPYCKITMDGKYADDVFNQNTSSQLSVRFSETNIQPDMYNQDDSLDLEINPDSCSIRIDGYDAFDVQDNGIYVERPVKIGTSSDPSIEIWSDKADALVTLDYITKHEKNIKTTRINELIAKAKAGVYDCIDLHGDVTLNNINFIQCNIEFDDGFILTGIKYDGSTYNASGLSTVICTDYGEVVSATYLVPIGK